MTKLELLALDIVRGRTLARRNPYKNVSSKNLTIKQQVERICKNEATTKERN